MHQAETAATPDGTVVNNGRTRRSEQAHVAARLVTGSDIRYDYSERRRNPTIAFPHTAVECDVAAFIRSTGDSRDVIARSKQRQLHVRF
jgi:hypothetical protein